MEIGDKIRSIRTSRGYSQEFLAEQLGITQGTYSRIESGGKISVERLISIAKVLKVTPNDILNFSPNNIQPSTRKEESDTISHLKKQITLLEGTIRDKEEIIEMYRAKNPGNCES